MMDVFSSAYFPGLIYCKSLFSSVDVRIDIGEHFVKQTQRNRAYIKGPNGLIKLIVPLEKRKNRMPVKDVRISYAEDWRKLHWKTLESCYRSSPYFEFYEDRFAKVIHSDFNFLKDLNEASIQLLLDITGKEIEYKYSESFIPADGQFKDHRNIQHEPEIRSERQYIQVFRPQEFQYNLSFIDLVCNEGPNSLQHLNS